MTDPMLEQRLRSLRGSVSGDWLDVRRRGERLERARRLRRAAVVAAAVVGVLLITVPAFGIGERLLELLSIRRSTESLPGVLHRRPHVAFIADRRLFRPGKGALALGAPLRPLRGDDSVAATASRDGRYVAYESAIGSTPILRLFDTKRRVDIPIAIGTDSPAWSADGALAYWHADAVRQPQHPYLGHVVVRARPDSDGTAWTTTRGAYHVIAWAGRTLLVEIEPCLLCKHALEPGIVALTGPHTERRLPVSRITAVSPDGQLVIGGWDTVAGQDSPSPYIRVVDVHRAKVITQLDLRDAHRPGIPVASLAAGIRGGTWIGKRIITTTASGNSTMLVILKYEHRRLRVERVLQLNRAAPLPHGYGPFVAHPIPLDAEGRRIIMSVTVAPKRPHQWFRGFMTCDVAARKCTLGRRMALRHWMTVVYNASRP